MNISNLKTRLMTNLSNIQIVQAIRDNLKASNDNMLRLINFFNELCFGDHRDEAELIERGGRYFYQLTDEEVDKVLETETVIATDAYSNITLAEGTVVKMIRDAEDNSVYAIDAAGNRVDVYNSNLQQACCELPNAFTSTASTSQAVLSDLVSSFDVNNVILTFSEGMCSGLSSISDIVGYVRSQLPNLQGEAMKVFANISDVLAQGNVVGFIEYIKNMYGNLSTVHQTQDNYIEFDSTDYSTKAFTVGHIASGLISTIGTIVGAIVAIAAPVIGLIISGASLAVGKVVSFIEENEHLDHAEVNHNVDNLSLAVPIHQISIDDGLYGMDAFMSFLRRTGRVLEYRVPGLICDIWKNSRDLLGKMESKLDLGWRKFPHELGLYRVDNVWDGSTLISKEFVITYSNLMDMENKIRNAYDDGISYSADDDLTYQDDEGIRTRIAIATSWYVFSVFWQFLKYIAQTRNWEQQHLTEIDDIIVLISSSSATDRSNDTSSFNWFEDAFLDPTVNFHAPTWEVITDGIANLSNIFFPIASPNRSYHGGRQNYQPVHWDISLVDGIGGHVVDSDTIWSNMIEDHFGGREASYMIFGRNLAYGEENSDNYYYSVDGMSGCLEPVYGSVSITSKSKSYVIPPSYSRSSLILTAIISGVIIVATTAAVIATTTIVKSRIRSSFATKYADVENKREDLKNAIKTGDVDLIKAKEKAYIKSVKKYNLSAKILGQSTLNFTDGWQSGESAETLLTKLSTTVDTMSKSDLAVSDDNTMSACTLNDVFKLIKGSL